MLTDEYVKRVYAQVEQRDGVPSGCTRGVRDHPAGGREAPGVREGRRAGAHRRAGARGEVSRGLDR